MWLIWLKFVGADIILERLSVGRTALFPSLNENLLRGFVICLPLASSGVKLSNSPIIINRIHIIFDDLVIVIVVMLMKYTDVDVNCSKK